MIPNNNRFGGAGLCTAILILFSPATLPAQQLYWSQFGSQIGLVSQVGHVNLNGSGSVTLVQSNQVFGMETLNATRQVYWIDGGAAAIMRANADFSGVTTLVTGLGASYHLNLALDPAANLIFWSNADSGTIGRANLGGGPILGTFTSPGKYPDDLAVDPASQLLYWETQTGEVLRSHYDGSDQVTLLTIDSGYGASGLALDLAAGQMYLSIPNQHRIVRANLDGTGLQTVLSTTERPFGMELFNGRMYWTDLDSGRLRSANLDGTDPTTILANLSLPRQISIMAAPVGDSDGDGVPDSEDLCPGTPPGAIVDAHGCSIDQLVPCAGPRSGGEWKNHGHYVSAVAKAAEVFFAAGLITEEQAEAIVSAAGRSGCGK